MMNRYAAPNTIGSPTKIPSPNRNSLSVIASDGSPLTEKCRFGTSASVPPVHNYRVRRLAKKTVPANAKSTDNRANVSRPSATSMNRYMTEKDAAIQMATLRIVHTHGTVTL